MLRWIIPMALLFASAPVDAKQLVLKGTPIVQLSASPDEANRHLLEAGERHEYMLLITKQDDGSYVWESRQELPLVVQQAGAYTHFISPVHGWIKVGSMAKLQEGLQLAKAAGLNEEGLEQLLGRNFLAEWMTEHEYFYWEFVTQGMFVAMYWSVADEYVP